MIKIILSATEARKLAKTVGVCMSTEETRYYLNGICLEASPEGLLALSTDGHRLASQKVTPLVVQDDSFVQDTTTQEFRVIISTDAVEWLGKLPRKVTSLHTVSFEFDDSTLALTLQLWEWDRLQSSANFKLIDGNFPDHRRVTPEITPDTARIRFNARYLMEMCKAAIESYDDKRGVPVIDLYFNDSSAPANIKGSNGLEMVLMPMRMA